MALRRSYPSIPPYRSGRDYGDEVKFGGSKVIRDGMGQSPISHEDGAVDLVITNALILDWWGVVKADISIKGSGICGKYDHRL